MVTMVTQRMIVYMMCDRSARRKDIEGEDDDGEEAANRALAPNPIDHEFARLL